jgi:NADH dehydrogenase
MVVVRDGIGNPQRLPGVAPVAIQQGRYAARVIRARIADRRAPAPFRYRSKGNVATIGRGRAVADLGPLRLSGAPAWCVWLVVHLWYLTGFQNRLLVIIQWSFSFISHGRGARLIDEPPLTAPHRDSDAQAAQYPHSTAASPASHRAEALRFDQP